MDDFNRYCKFQVKLGEIILLRVEVPSVCNRYVRFAALRSLMKYLQNYLIYHPLILTPTKILSLV